MAIRIPIHRYGTTVSTITIGAKTASGTARASLTAIMLALPPVQEADRAPKPDQNSWPTSGLNRAKERTAPAIMPAAPMKKIARAVGPSRRIARMSTGSRSSTRLAGSRQVVIRPYTGLCAVISPQVAASIGRK